MIEIVGQGLRFLILKIGNYNFLMQTILDRIVKLSQVYSKGHDTHSDFALATGN